jgi:hypothetical protein
MSFQSQYGARTSAACAMLLLIGVSGALAQAPNNSPKASVPDLSGFWERKDEFGGGNFGGTLERIPRAAVKPEVLEQARKAAAAQQRGEVVSYGSKWCLTNSYPFFMQHSAAWDIVQTPDEIALVPEVHTFVRHIYLDGRKHPDPQHLMPSANGHAVGHWEGDTLVVDTVGFVGGGGTPGGGRVGKGTHLTERFKLMDGGKTLSVTSTWEDPALYLKPHTYEMTYHRSEPGTYAFEEYCHADDPVQGGSVVQPAQK